MLVTQTLHYVEFKLCKDTCMFFIKSKQILRDKEKYAQLLPNKLLPQPKSFGLTFSHSTDFGNTCFRYMQREQLTKANFLDHIFL